MSLQARGTGGQKNLELNEREKKRKQLKIRKRKKGNI